jgi:chemosensory pili system protein ChpA (sensor histidine kinase/response regulator)
MSIESPDLTALSWCLGEIRESLSRAQAAIEAQQSQGDNDRSQTALARTLVHQASGALQFVDLEGVRVVTMEAEHLLALSDRGELAMSPEFQGVLVRAFAAVCEYLESVAMGSGDSPLKLFANYREMVALRGVERAEPVELFFPDLSLRAPRPGSDGDTANRDIATVRASFERGMLGFLRDQADTNAIGEMRKAVERLLHAHPTSALRTFWWLSVAFLDGLRVKVLPVDLVAKREVTRIHQQVKRAHEVGIAVPDRAIRELLLQLGTAGKGSEKVDEVKLTFGLVDAIPADLERMHYGLVDNRGLRAAREATVQAKNAWEKFARGSAADLPAFASAAQQLDASMARLPWGGLKRLAATIGGLRRALAASASNLAELLSLELATALLFIEQALERGPAEVDQYDWRAAELAARLDALCERQEGDAEPMPEWLAELSRAAQTRLTLQAFVGELQINLRACERVLDAFFRDPGARADLLTLGTLLGQVSGAFRLLGHDEAACGADSVAGRIAAFLDAAEAPSQADCEQVAANLGALGFFAESLRDADRHLGGFQFAHDELGFNARLRKPGLLTIAASASVEKTSASIQTAEPIDLTEPIVLTTDESSIPMLSDAIELVADAHQQPGVVIETDGMAADPSLGIIGAPVFIDAPAVEAKPIPADVDAELMSIFLEEAGEVLAAIEANRSVCERSPADSEAMTTLRRGFHTLKGSSRMVGLDALGGAAWAIEQVLNDWLSGEHPATHPLLNLVGDAHRLFADWVALLVHDPRANIDARALIARASSIKAGADASAFDLTAFETPARTSELIELPVDIGSIELADEGNELPVAFDMITLDGHEPVSDDVSEPSIDTSTDSGTETSTDASDDSQVRVGERMLSGSLFRIFLTEADDLLFKLGLTQQTWGAMPSMPASDDAVRAAHSLAGICRIVGLLSVRSCAEALERFLAAQSIAGRSVSQLDLDDYGFVLDRLTGALHQFAAGQEPATDDRMNERAADLARRWSSDEAVSVPEAAAGMMAFEEGLELDGEADLEEGDADQVVALDDELDPDLGPVFIEEADELMPRIGEALTQWAQRPADTAAPESLMRLLHTVKGSARMAGAMQLGSLVHDLETEIEQAIALPAISEQTVEALISRNDLILTVYEALRNPNSAAATAAARQAFVPAGEPPSLSDAIASVQAAEGAAALKASEAPVAPTQKDRVPPARAALRPVAVQPTANHPMIRVRADLLDRLVNEAGEVSISRARLDNEIGGIRQSLGELTENVNRLRSQLREIELAADSQIQSRIARNREVDSDFDPLEFDRYTRFQELSRMLAESVNDVATVQQNAMRSLDEAARDLSRQNQVTRELQQDLMRIRLVQFGSVSDRMYRVVRQAAKELGKRVNLEIKGADAELDRGVLERMSGPIEHLLRNAVAHGIESRTDRLSAGKAETGEICLTVGQEGSEVTLRFTDDGAGLNYPRILDRATERGLIAPGSRPNERELAQMIFMPGFSTAPEVTELAGRGVGMDVVRAEVAAMGGRIELDSTPGLGTCFDVHLPVSLAIAQVVLLTVGSMRVAVPSALVEQVLQLKPDALAAGYADHTVEWQGASVPLYFFGSMLEMAECTPLAQRYSPVVLLRSGAERLAVHVDHVSPSTEVVVKNVGPQLARVTGMAGATVLGNGEIVLILNPVQIAQSGAGHQAGQGDTAGFAPMRIEVAHTVMVVDDSVTVRKVTQRLLSRDGYHVVLARDGLDAMRQLQDVVPDLMLLDIEMPRMDGFDVARKMREDERWKSVPIVMISSRTADKHRDHAFSLGVSHFLGKPYEEGELLRLVKTLTSESHPVT